MRKCVYSVIFSCMIVEHAFCAPNYNFAGTWPAQFSVYTIDTRKYIDDKTWATKPYNYVLKMTTASGGRCTASMVDGKILTARHCTYGADVANTSFVAYDGTRLRIKSGQHGDYGPNNRHSGGDWSVLIPDNTSQKFVTAHSVQPANVPVNTAINLSMIGYGALKIMSDWEIANLKAAYKQYLIDTASSKEKLQVFSPNSDLSAMKQIERIDTISGKGKNFVDLIRKNPKNVYSTKYMLDSSMFKDSDRLKLSTCRARLSGAKYMFLPRTKCRIWGGNSGGGVFTGALGSYNLIAIVVTSKYDIGGKTSATGIVSSSAFMDALRNPRPETRATSTNKSKKAKK